MSVMNIFGYQNAFEESISAVTATPSVELGSRRIQNGEEYVYCYNAGGAAIDKNLGVKLITGASGYSVAATSLTDTVNPCVGIVRNVTMAAADYGWIMTKGFANVKYHANSTITADYAAVGLSTDGRFGLSAFGTSVVGTNNVAGFAIGANTASGGTFYAFIRTGF